MVYHRANKKKGYWLASIPLTFMQQRFSSVQSRRLQKGSNRSRLHPTKPLPQSPLSPSTIQSQTYLLIWCATTEERPNQQTQGIRRSASRSFFNHSHTLSASRRKAAPLFSKTLHQQWNKSNFCVHYTSYILTQQQHVVPFVGYNSKIRSLGGLRSKGSIYALGTCQSSTISDLFR
jgi:hypothetical protein